MSGLVAIAGFASATREAVYKSRADEVWSLNMLHSSKTMRKLFPLNITRLFELHPKWMLQKDWYANDDHWGWLTRIKHHYPVYLIEDYPEIHNGVRYPLEAVNEKFLNRLWRDGENIQYYTSSFCYMLPLAVMEGFDRIEVYGFEMGSDTEYVYQKSGAEFWIGVCSQYADIYMHKDSLLCKSKLYGFEGGQLVHPDTLEEYRMYYMSQVDGLALPPATKDKFIKGNLINGAVSLIDEIVSKGDSISRQVLEGYKNKFQQASKKLATEINTLNAQTWNGGDSEPLFEKAFDRWRLMYRYEGAYQLSMKLIQELDLQSPSMELENRYRFHPFSTIGGE